MEYHEYWNSYRVWRQRSSAGKVPGVRGLWGWLYEHLLDFPHWLVDRWLQRRAFRVWVAGVGRRPWAVALGSNRTGVAVDVSVQRQFALRNGDAWHRQCGAARQGLLHVRLDPAPEVRLVQDSLFDVAEGDVLLTVDYFPPPARDDDSMLSRRALGWQYPGDAHRGRAPYVLYDDGRWEMPTQAEALSRMPAPMRLLDRVSLAALEAMHDNQGRLVLEHKNEAGELQGDLQGELQFGATGG